ncbi:TPA: hypothetical protein KWI17_001696 [Enterobacter cloacae]|nr:hypothetical protein [Enterobacter cloacae]
MKSASDFILDLRQSEELCKTLEHELSSVNIDNSQECIKCIINVGNTFGYHFTERDYKDAAEEFSRNKTLESIPIVNEDIIKVAWTTGGASCISHCPTRSDVCPI